MNITIIGAGAIGAICGAYLTKAGRNVVLVEPHDEHRRLIRRGARIDGVRGEMTVPLNAIAPKELSEELELALLTVKSGKTIEALQTIKPFVGRDSIVVSLQNSINEDTIASVIGAERTIGCITGWGATFIAPGHLRQASEGKFTIGELDGRITERLARIKEILDDITETGFTDNIYGHRWSKLCVNALIAGCAVLGSTVGEALASERNKRIFIKLVGEVVTVARACGVTLEKFEGVVDPAIFTRTDAEGMELCSSILDMMAAVHGGIKPGFLQDLEKGIETEVAFINGYCARRGEEHGVAAPVNAMVTDLLKKMEAGLLAPSPDHIVLLEKAAQ
jgi:2-dehydropantoate 2-reductase